MAFAEDNAFSRTACNRLSVNLRIAAAVACEVNIFAVRRECGLCINTAARRELSEILSVGIQQINLRAAVLRQSHGQRAAVRAKGRRTVVAAESSDLTTFAVSPVALVAGVACAVCVTVYNCLCPRRELRDYPVSMLQAWAFLMGAVLFELSMHPWTLCYTPSLRGVGGILFVVLFGNLLAFNLYMTGVKLIGPEKSVLYGFAEPVTAAHFGRGPLGGGGVCVRRPFLFMRDGHSSHNGCPTRCTPQHRMYLRSTGSLFHRKLAVSTKNCCLFTLFCHKKR